MPPFQPVFINPPPQASLPQLPSVQTGPPPIAGIAKGLETFFNARAEKRKEALKEKQTRVSAYGAVMKNFGSQEPGAGMVMQKVLESAGVSTDEAKDFAKLSDQFAKSKNKQDVAVVRKFIGRLGSETGFDLTGLARLYREHPAQFFEGMKALREGQAQRQRANVTAGLDETKTPEMARSQAFQAGLPDLGKDIASAYGLNKGPLVQVTPGDTEEAKKLAGIRAKGYETISNEAAAARKALTNLSSLEPLLERANAGPGTPQAITAKRALAGAARIFGFDTVANSIQGEDVPAAEAATAVANQLTLSLKNVFNLGVRGFDTPAEREFVQNLSPGLATTKQGRAVLFPLLRKQYGRQLEMKRAADKYLQKNGTLVGLDAHLDKMFSGKPVFTKADIRKAASVSAKIQTTGIPKIKTDADYDALPSGTVFIDPTGKRRRKP